MVLEEEIILVSSVVFLGKMRLVVLYLSVCVCVKHSIFILRINISTKTKAREMACQTCTSFIKSAGNAVHLAASNPVARELAQGVEEQSSPPPVENP